MKFTDIFYIVYISVSFVSWPIMAVHLGISPFWSGSIAMGVTALVVPLSSIVFLKTSAIPNLKVALLFALISVANGIAIPIYSHKTTMLGDESGIFVAAVSIGMVIIAPFLTIYLKGGVVTPKIVIGALIASFGVYVMVS